MKLIRDVFWDLDRTPVINELFELAFLVLYILFLLLFIVLQHLIFKILKGVLGLLIL